MDTAASSSAVFNYDLGADNELCFEAGEDIFLELVEGEAEVFGTPLAKGERYSLPSGFRGALFTFVGAKLELRGQIRSAYVARHTPMLVYLHTHAALDVMRRSAKEALNTPSKSTETQQQYRGPRLLVVGPTDVGKSTLCRILCNYAVRQGHTPQLVDLDIGQGSISVPGTLASLVIDKPADLVDGFDRSSAHVLNFGYLTPSANLKLYDFMVKQLATAVKQNARQSLPVNVGGYIVNTCGWVEGEGYNLIVKAAEAFEPDVIVVLDQEKLYNELRRDLPNFVKICYLPKSEGVATRSRATRISRRRSVIHQYFYGTERSPKRPYLLDFSYDKPFDQQELQIAKVGAGMPSNVPSPLVQTNFSVDHRLMVMPLSIDQSQEQLLPNHLLALMPSDSTIDQTLLGKPCIGFLLVTAIDPAKKTIAMLSPFPQPLPSRIALFSDVTYLPLLQKEERRTFSRTQNHYQDHVVERRKPAKPVKMADTFGEIKEDEKEEDGEKEPDIVVVHSAPGNSRQGLPGAGEEPPVGAPMQKRPRQNEMKQGEEEEDPYPTARNKKEQQNAYKKDDYNASKDKAKDFRKAFGL